MILDFVRDLIGDGIVLTLSMAGLWLFAILLFLLGLAAWERRKEKKRRARGELSAFDKSILRMWGRL